MKSFEPQTAGVPRSEPFRTMATSAIATTVSSTETSADSVQRLLVGGLTNVVEQPHAENAVYRVVRQIDGEG